MLFLVVAPCWFLYQQGAKLGSRDTNLNGHGSIHDSSVLVQVVRQQWLLATDWPLLAKWSGLWWIMAVILNKVWLSSILFCA